MGLNAWHKAGAGVGLNPGLRSPSSLLSARRPAVGSTHTGWPYLARSRKRDCGSGDSSGGMVCVCMRGRGVKNSGQEAVVISPGGALAASQGHSGLWGAWRSVMTSRERVGEGWGVSVSLGSVPCHLSDPLSSNPGLKGMGSMPSPDVGTYPPHRPGGAYYD